MSEWYFATRLGHKWLILNDSNWHWHHKTLYFIFGLKVSNNNDACFKQHFFGVLQTLSFCAIPENYKISDWKSFPKISQAQDQILNKMESHNKIWMDEFSKNRIFWRVEQIGYTFKPVQSILKSPILIMNRCSLIDSRYYRRVDTFWIDF